MKKTVSVILFLAFTRFSAGQVWCDSGATWYYGFQSAFSDGYYKLSYAGDTLIGANTCKKIKKEMVYYNFWGYDYDTLMLGYEFTYADTDKVYLSRFNTFYTLYDFSASVGDTLLVPGNNQYSGCDSVGWVKVDSTGTMSINSQNLRYYSVSTLFGSNWGWNCRIVEKAGPIYSYPGLAMNYFLPCKLDRCGLVLDEIPEGGTFRCYEDNNFSLFQVITQSCDYTLAVPKETSIGHLRVYPNPAEDFITLEFHAHAFLTYRLLDAYGRIQREGELSKSPARLDIRSLSKGAYFLVLQGDGLLGVSGVMKL